GTIGEATPIIALPGDPVSVQVAYEVFVRPAVLSMAGYSEKFRSTVQARVTSGWYSPRDRREFVRVEVTGSPQRGYTATPAGTPEALLLSALARANALAVVSEDITDVAAGDELP